MAGPTPLGTPHAWGAHGGFHSCGHMATVHSGAQRGAQRLKASRPLCRRFPWAKGQQSGVAGGLSRAACLQMTLNDSLTDYNIAARCTGLEKVTCYGSSVLLQLPECQPVDAPCTPCMQLMQPLV